MSDTLETLTNEARSMIEVMEANLPQLVDAASISATAKLPFKALIFRESLIWRMAELCRSAFDHFQKDALASGVLLARAAIETCAACWYLRAKIESALRSDDIADLDEYLMRLALGSQSDPNLPNPIRVGTFIKRVAKDLDGFDVQYGLLSEVAHPNWAGTALLYSDSDKTKLQTQFGPNLRGLTSTKEIGMANLRNSLIIFEANYNRISDLMSNFVALCERELSAKESR